MTNAPILIRVADFAGGPLAVSAEDGQRLRERIAHLLAADSPVALSFAGIEILTGAFLAASVGPFCADFSEADLARLMTFRDIPADHQKSVNLCMKNARRYCANRAAYDAAWKEEMGSLWSGNEHLNLKKHGARQC
jgi:hypothetical protein